MAKKKPVPIRIAPESEFNPEDPQVGFYNLSEEVYRPAPGCNWSIIKKIEKTAKTYKYALEHPQGDTPALKFGRLFHTMVLEEELISKRYTPFPETYVAKWTPQSTYCKKWKADMEKLGFQVVTKSKKEYESALVFESDEFKAAYAIARASEPADRDPTFLQVPESYESKWNLNATFCRDWVADIEAKGIECVKQSDLLYARAMRKELWALKDARDVLEDADGYEVSMFWYDGNDDETKILCKAKVDIMKDGVIGDLKKVASQGGRGSASWNGFCGVVRNYKYHGQAAFYRDGYDAVCKALGYDLPETSIFTWLIVEDSPPYDTAIYTIYNETDSIDTYEWFNGGRELYRHYLWLLRLSIEHDRWPSYNYGPSGATEDMDLTKPDWISFEIR